MKHEIIKTENYLLVVTDKGSLEGYAYHTISQEVYPIGMFFTPVERIVVCHLPLNDSPILDGVDLLDNNIFINYLKEFGYWNSFCIFIEKLYNEKRNI